MEQKAKEKANELVAKYFEVIAKATGYKGLKNEGENKFYAIEKVAKQCALININETLNEVSSIFLIDPKRDFWNEVKQEIEKNLDYEKNNSKKTNNN